MKKRQESKGKTNKPPGYWRDFENVKRELTYVIGHEYRDAKGNLARPRGDFPTSTELIESRQSGLLAGINKNHGGLRVVRERMGYRSKTKPNGYWRDVDNVKRELKTIIENEYRDDRGSILKSKDTPPMSTFLQKSGHSGLLNGIRKHHGGWSAFARRMGYHQGELPNGYWHDFRNIRREMESVIKSEYRDKDGKIIKKKGRFPTGAQLKYIGKSKLRDHLRGRFRISETRRRMGYPATHGSAEYWKVFANIREELKEIIEHEYLDADGNLIKPRGEFPTGSQFKKIGKRPLLYVIEKYHTLSEARRKMGCQANTSKPGRWKSFENIAEHLKRIIETECHDKSGNLVKSKGEFPSNSQLRQSGFSGMANAISQYHGGLPAVGERMGYPRKEAPRGYWSSFENIKRELKNIIHDERLDENGNLVKSRDEFPTQRQLLKMGRYDLLGAISRHHDGLVATKERMGYAIGKKRNPYGYWKSIANVTRELKKIVDNEYIANDGSLLKPRGKFPTSTDLDNIGQGALTVALTIYHGGISAVRQQMGYSLSHKPRNYWQNRDNVKNELQHIIENEYFDDTGNLVKAKNEFPTGRQLHAIGKSAMVINIRQHYGSLPAAREAFGHELLGKPSGYWQDFKNLKKHLEKIIDSEYSDDAGNTIKRDGEFPSATQLQQIREYTLLKWLGRYHGCLPAIKERMGYGKGVPRHRVQEFMRKAETVEGAKELLGCPDLTMADKADILIARSKETFRSREYTEWVMGTMFDMTSLKPYLRRDDAPHRHFDPYDFGRHDLSDVMDRYPRFLETPSTYELVLRKLENIYFKKMRQDRAGALRELRRKKKHEGILGQLYDQVHKNCKEIFALRIPGTVTKIKNPYKVKERKLLEDGTVEWIHSGKASEYVEFPAVHQKRGILHIARHKRILIADEMGTGKTAQAVLAKLYLDHKSSRRLKTLIICPNSVKELWIEKIDEYCKNISRKEIVVLAGHRNKEAALKHTEEDIDFVITNYALLSRSPDEGQFNLVDELTKVGFDYVIVDEVHNAKNMDANRAISVSKITKDVEYLVLLSGTPIPNRLKDMGMTMHILDPQRFPNPIAFNRLYSKNPRILRDLLLSGRMLRVRANEVIQLPALKSRKITVNPTSHQREAYIRVFLDEKLNSYSKLAKLRRILIDPNIIPAYLDVSRAQSGKLKELDRIINEKATQGEKTVVYTNFKYRVTDMLARRYAKYGVCVIDGDVPARTRMDDDSDREKIRKQFQTGDKRVLIATIGTLCEGVDLTAARTVIFLDPPFTSTAMDQSTSRVHRLGQSRPVEVYNLIASDREIADITRHPETGQSGTIDEAMYDLVEKKERIIDHVVDGARLSKDELRLLEKNSDASQLLKSIAYAISPS